jgi:hypothetical protein
MLHWFNYEGGVGLAAGVWAACARHLRQLVHDSAHQGGALRCVTCCIGYITKEVWGWLPGVWPACARHMCQLVHDSAHQGGACVRVIPCHITCYIVVWK